PEVDTNRRLTKMRLHIRSEFRQRKIRRLEFKPAIVRAYSYSPGNVDVRPSTIDQGRSGLRSCSIDIVLIVRWHESQRSNTDNRVGVDPRQNFRHMKNEIGCTLPQVRLHGRSAQVAGVSLGILKLSVSHLGSRPFSELIAVAGLPSARSCGLVCKRHS